MTVSSCNIYAPIRLQEGSPKPFQVNSCSQNHCIPFQFYHLHDKLRIPTRTKLKTSQRSSSSSRSSQPLPCIAQRMLSHQRIRIARALAENDQPDNSERTQWATNVIVTANSGEQEADLCMHVSDDDQASARKKKLSSTTKMFVVDDSCPRSPLHQAAAHLRSRKQRQDPSGSVLYPGAWRRDRTRQEGH